MDVAMFVFSLAAGMAAALAAGAWSGVRIGREALGRDLAGYMGALYGGLTGTATVVLGLAVLALA